MKREEKIRRIRYFQIKCYTDRETIQKLGISRRTYFYWKKRIKDEGLAKVLVKQKQAQNRRNG